MADASGSSSFRCTHPKCGAHNFGRNLACIGCGSPRSTQSPPTSTTSPATQHTSVSSLQAQSSASNPGLMASMHAFGGMSQPQSPVTVRPSASPRFVSAPNLVPSPAPVPQRSTTSFGVVGGFNLNNLTTTRGDPTLRTASGHPLLTPSGRAFAVGGRVQNISLDPLSPCVMYWPDNEPFPEQGQIRPSNLAGVAHPPILNTGNRGPIAHQPGDWICKKCNYLNWRRRKVCQTCLPYAEGNGDSISAAVQAERIQLLTNVLLQNPTQQPQIQQPAPTQREENPLPACSFTLDTNASHQYSSSPSTTAPVTKPAASQRSLANMHTMRQMQAQALRSHSVTPPQVRDRMLEVHRARSQHDLLGSVPSGPREDPSPIYQTSGSRPSGMSVEERRDQLELSSLNAHMSSLNLWGTGTSPTPPSLLPSFLQEIVSSPTTSEHDLPAATSSSPPRTRNDRSRSSTNSSTSSGLESLEVRSIWKLDGEESKLFGSSQAGSRGGSRRGSPTMGK
ncbi:hypothetical protein VNI00_010149 [Paramarasmius palmivorus]|uniref:RanBP2-type domain-containing protein n=1 Tax=Paramarasmius palmivorus TaxID=297713 RepID=A0AAW0CKV3_9AGAR